MNYLKMSVSIIALLLLMFFSTGFQMVEAGEPSYGGTLTYPLPYPEAVSVLDPAHDDNTPSQIVIRNIFATLLRNCPETEAPIPGIAKSWEASDDGTVYTFYLREGVKFHHGRELTAEDVKFTYERLMCPEEASVGADMFLMVVGVDEFQEGKADEISGIEVLDPYTLRITLKEIDVVLPYTLAEEEAGIVPKEEVERLGTAFGRNPVGAGPFKLENWIRGAAIELVAFDDYYDGRPYLDRVIFQVMQEEGARVAAFRAGELDIDIVYPAQYEAYRKDPQFKDLLFEVPELWTRHIHFNLDHEGLSDVRVRQAFNHAIDRKLIVERVLADMAYPAVGWLPGGSPAFNPELEGYNYDPDRALELMKEAGYGPDNPLEIEIQGGTHPAWGIPIVEVAMPFLEKVGFKINPVVLDGATIVANRQVGNFDAYISSHGGRASPLRYLSYYFWSKTPRIAGNYSNYDNEQFDYYLEEAMRTPDFEKRIQLIQKAEEELVKDPPVWFFNYNKAVGIAQPWVHGVIPVQRELLYMPIEKIWIDETSPRKD